MKHFFVFLLLTALTFRAGAACTIRYVYDAAGNRILRYYDCTNYDDPVITNPPPDDPTGVGRPAQPKGGANPADPSGEVLIANIAPNPTYSVSTLTFSKVLQNATITITDGKGSVLRSDRINAATYRIDLEGYAAGTYFIAVRTESRTLSFKIDKL